MMLITDHLVVSGWSSPLAWERASLLVDMVSEAGMWLCSDLRAEIDRGAPQVVAGWCVEDGSRALCVPCLARHIEVDHPILPPACAECGRDDGTGRPVEPWRHVPVEGGGLVRLYLWGIYYCDGCLRRFALFQRGLR